MSGLSDVEDNARYSFVLLRNGITCFNHQAVSDVCGTVFMDCEYFISSILVLSFMNMRFVW